MSAFHKAPPHSVDAERAVLAACTLDPEAVDEVAEVVGHDDWYVDRHRVLWEAIAQVRTAGRSPDTVTLRQALLDAGKLQAVGGDDGLIELTNALPPANLRSHAEIIRDKAMLRRMVAECRNLAAEGMGHVQDTREFLDEAEARIFRAAEARHMSGGPRPIKEVLIERFTEIHEMAKRGSDVAGLETGFRALDLKLAGLKPGELIIVAGRPGMGKSAFAGGVAGHCAEAGAPALVFSLEMGAKQWVDRALSGEAGIDGNLLRTGNLNPTQWSDLNRAAGKLGDLPLYVDDTPSVSLMAVRSRARRVKRRHGLALLVVDYLQLMRSGLRHDSREQEVAEISRGLKSLSKELEVPVMALAQLNRGVESRGDKRPSLGDLRESGQLEQDADVVIFLYREEVYNPRSTEAIGKGEIIVAKQRSGPVGTVHVRWDARRTRFRPEDDEPVDWHARASAAANDYDSAAFQD